MKKMPQNSESSTTNRPSKGAMSHFWLYITSLATIATVIAMIWAIIQLQSENNRLKIREDLLSSRQSDLVNQLTELEEVKITLQESLDNALNQIDDLSRHLADLQRSLQRIDPESLEIHLTGKLVRIQMGRANARLVLLPRRTSMLNTAPNPIRILDNNISELGFEWPDPLPTDDPIIDRTFNRGPDRRNGWRLNGAFLTIYIDFYEFNATVNSTRPSSAQGSVTHRYRPDFFSSFSAQITSFQ